MNLIPDWTIIPMWFIFMACLFVLNRFVFRPTLNILSERKKKTIGLEKDVRYFEEQSEIKLKEYESLMMDANNLARNARDEILKAANGQQREINSEAKQEAEKQMAKVKDQIKHESTIARQNLKQYSDQLAQEIADKLIERKVA